MCFASDGCPILSESNVHRTHMNLGSSLDSGFERESNESSSFSLEQFCYQKEK